MPEPDINEVLVKYSSNKRGKDLISDSDVSLRELELDV